MDGSPLLNPQKAYLNLKSLSFSGCPDQIDRFDLIRIFFPPSLLPRDMPRDTSGISFRLDLLELVGPLISPSLPQVVIAWFQGMTGPTLGGVTAGAPSPGRCMIATSSGGDHHSARHYGGQMKRINAHNQQIHHPGPTTFD